MQEIHQATQAFLISSSPQQISPRPTVLDACVAPFEFTADFTQEFDAAFLSEQDQDTQ